MKFVLIAISIIAILCILYVHHIKHSERRLYNNGYCRCGRKWIYVGLTQAGSRMYKCDFCDRHIIKSKCE